MNTINKLKTLAVALTATFAAATAVAGPWPFRFENNVADRIASSTKNYFADPSAEAVCEEFNLNVIPQLKKVDVMSLTAAVEVDPEFGINGTVCAIRNNGEVAYSFDKTDVEMIQNGQSSTQERVMANSIAMRLSKDDAFKVQKLLTP